MKESPLNKLFKRVLGAEIKVKSNSMDSNEKIFAFIIDSLEESKKIENGVFETSHIDVTSITDPLWSAIMESFQLLWGENIAEIIYFYMHDRIDEEGEITPLIGLDGKEYYFNNVKDLWSYIKHNNENE